MKKLLSVLLVVVMLMGLSVTAFAAGVDSPDNDTPPVFNNKEVKGEGETKDGTKVTVEVLDIEKLPESFPFDDADEAVEEALKSKTAVALLEKLEIKEGEIAGTSLLAVTLEGAKDDEDAVVVVLFYDEDGKPVGGAYFYEDAWYPITVEAGEKDGEFVLAFELDEDEKGLEAEVTVTVEDKK